MIYRSSERNISVARFRPRMLICLRLRFERLRHFRGHFIDSRRTSSAWLLSSAKYFRQ